MNHLTKNNTGTSLWDDPIQVKLFVAAILAGLYILASTFKVIIELAISKNHNVFIVMRLVYYLLVLNIFYGYYMLRYLLKRIREQEQEQNEETKINEKHNIILFVSVKVLSLALILLSLSVFPTLLLLFAHPENTFALIVIHVALFYTETMIGVYIIERLNRRHTTNRNGYIELKDVPDDNTVNHQTGTEEGQPGTGVMLFQLISGSSALIIVLISIYFALIGLYQFLIVRNASSNVAFDMVIQYVPSIAIGALGFFVSKTNNQETMNSKNAKRWLQLGELLDTDTSKDDSNKKMDLDENKKNQIKCLQKVFKQDKLLEKLTQLQQTISEVGLKK